MLRMTVNLNNLVPELIASLQSETNGAQYRLKTGITNRGRGSINVETGFR